MRDEAVLVPAAPGFWDRTCVRGWCARNTTSCASIISIPETNTFIGQVNLGNPGEYTIRQLAEEVRRLTGSRSKLAFKPLRARKGAAGLEADGRTGARSQEDHRVFLRIAFETS